MLFSSLTFLLIFLPLCLFFYFIIKDIRYKNIILLIFSLIFYAWGEPIYIFLMIFSILITYIFGLLINNSKHKKIYFIIGIVLLLLNLLFFKYSNFIIDNINNIFNLNIKSLNLPLPIGISFYTFQALSYLIDLYRGKFKVQKNILNLALYISLFPQLIAGPIVRYEQVERQINYREETLEKVVTGIKRFIIGLSKKVILANSMALICDTIYSNYSNYGTLILWVAAITFSFQIFFDFSGYSDMAIGLGKIFGFDFLENFNYPYISKSITEFWRRWHISLSSWFKDYIYIPLGGSHCSTLKNIRNICIVWLLTGLWHGANWNYIIWGIYFGILLLLEKFIFKKYIDKTPNIIRHLVVLFLIIISWTIFKIEDINSLLIILKNMLIFKSDNISLFIHTNSSLFFNFLFIIPCIFFSIEHKNKSINNIIIYNITNICYFILFIINIVFIIGSNYNPFIYFRF